MTEHPNATLIRRGYDAFRTGDMSVFQTVLADDVVEHQPTGNFLAGDYKGRDAVLGFYGRLFQETGGTFKIDLERVLVNENRVVTVHRTTAERNGRALDCRTSLVFELVD